MSELSAQSKIFFLSISLSLLGHHDLFQALCQPSVMKWSKKKDKKKQLQGKLENENN